MGRLTHCAAVRSELATKGKFAILFVLLPSSKMKRKHNGEKRRRSTANLNGTMDGLEIEITFKVKLRQAGNATAIVNGIKVEPKTPTKASSSAAQHSFAPSSVFGAVKVESSSSHYSAGSGVNQLLPTSTAAVILREVGATALLQRVGRPEPLTPELRRMAINTIADHFVLKKIPLSIRSCRNLESELLSLFPGEQESDYKTSDRSRMYVRYNNKKRLEKQHANIRRKLIWTPTTPEPLSPKTTVAQRSQSLPDLFDEVPDAGEK